MRDTCTVWWFIPCFCGAGTRYPTLRKQTRFIPLARGTTNAAHQSKVFFIVRFTLARVELGHNTPGRGVATVGLTSLARGNRRLMGDTGKPQTSAGTPFWKFRHRTAGHFAGGEPSSLCAVSARFISPLAQPAPSPTIANGTGCPAGVQTFATLNYVAPRA